MSKALWKSINTSPVSSQVSFLNKILSLILTSAVLVELPEWRLIVIIHIANSSLEDNLIATLLHVVKDFR